MRRYIAALTICFCCCSGVVAQTEFGVSPISEGTSFLVAFPPITPNPIEMPIKGKPCWLIISAQNAAHVRIQRADLRAVPAFDTTVTVQAGGTQRIRIPSFLTTPKYTDSSERITSLGVSVHSDRAITVVTSFEWFGNGERSVHYPTTAWGKDYRAVSFYQDRYGTGVPYNEQPGQFLILAAHDSTFVTYTPTVDTKGGPDAPATRKGESRTITLHRGQTFLIRGSINRNLTKEFVTDLTGTSITSNKPIAVITGHTKVAIMRMPDILPPTGVFAVPASFVRSAIQESAPPNTLAGTEFLTIPIMYTPLRRVGNENLEFGIDDDRGDVIRILSLSNNTIVEKYDSEASQYRRVAVLKAGEYYHELSVTEPALWRTSKPAHCYQYGKSWAGLLPPVFGAQPHKSEVEYTQGFPTVESGLPMLQSVPPVDRWISHAQFEPMDSVDNFVTILYRSIDSARITLNERVFSDYPVGTRLKVAGTMYTCIRLPITTSGTQTISTNKGGVTFAAWSYGSRDGLTQGCSYGHTLGMNLTQDCVDSLSLNTTTGCNESMATVILSGDSCARFASIEYEADDNTEVQISPYEDPDVRTVHVRITQRVVSHVPSTVTITARTSSGRYVRSTVTTLGESIPRSTTPQTDFGTLSVGTVTRRYVNLDNQTSDTVRCTLMIGGPHPNTELISDENLLLLPQSSTSVEVQARAIHVGQYSDTLWARTSCGSMIVLSELRTTVVDSTTNISEDNIKSSLTVTVVPSPVQGTSHISITGLTEGTYRISIVNSSGMVITSATYTNTFGEQTTHLPMPSNLVPGVYVVRVQQHDRASDITVPVVGK